MSPWRELEELLETYDGDFKCDVATACCWSGQLRITLTNPAGAPSLSIVFYSVAGFSPEEVARRVLDDFAEWTTWSGQTPMRPQR